MRLGIGSYTFTWAIGVPGHPPARPMDAIGLLQAAAELGVGVVQVCDNLPLAALSPRDLDAFAAEATQRGISVEVGTRGLDEGNLRAYLGLAGRFASPFVRLVVDRPGDEPSPIDVVERLRPAVAEFRRAGVRLALENHDRFAACVLAGIVERLGRDVAGVCLDTVNSFGALEGPGVVVETLAPAALSLHVKDFTVRRVEHQMGFVVEGRPAGDGRLDIAGLLGRVRAAGRDPNAILELWTPPAATLEATVARERAWAEQSVAFLRTLIADS